MLWVDGLVHVELLCELASLSTIFRIVWILIFIPVRNCLIMFRGTLPLLLVSGSCLEMSRGWWLLHFVSSFSTSFLKTIDIDHQSIDLDLTEVEELPKMHCES